MFINTKYDFCHSRYYAIVHPLKAQYLCTMSKAKKTVLLAWLSALLLGVPVLFVQVRRDICLSNLVSICREESLHSHTHTHTHKLSLLLLHILT